ncbi:hypothetical protein GCM10010971_26670 [Silvimonas amylolytica]|uniref:Uncharacterized protein n=1 Tax=Silvimonas amylolytica TaxID=449663 RepID=A0ABQ2PMM6_9NEIS|nr:hypothetical protein GCM10010971_26670 [Silvimonas amylolytica]
MGVIKSLLRWGVTQRAKLGALVSGNFDAARRIEPGVADAIGIAHPHSVARCG